MSENTPPVPVEPVPVDAPPVNPMPASALPFVEVPVTRSRRPFSKLAITGLAVSVLGFLFFLPLGVLGGVLSGSAIRRIRRDDLRGHGLAVAGAVVGIIAFVLRALVQFHVI